MMILLLNKDRRYNVIQCTGYLKPWTQINECEDVSGKSLGLEEETDGSVVGADSGSANNTSCLVAVGRVINNLASSSLLSDIVKPPCFTSKHTIDGKFLSVDQMVTYIVGFLPQELLGTSMYEYFHQDDIARLVDVHKATLQECTPKDTETYKFRAKDKTFVNLRSEWKSFRNPWTKDIEFIVANNILTRSDYKPDSSNKSECSSQGRTQNNYDSFTEQQLSTKSQQQLGNREIQNLITSHIEANKIGRHIVDTALDVKKATCDIYSSPLQAQQDTIEEESKNDRLQFLSSPLAMFTEPGTMSSNGGDGGGSGDTVSSYTVIQDSVNMLNSTNINDNSESILGDIMKPAPQQLSNLGTNDDATMAVIMSLLEADAGLGGPIDFSGLPWPLP